MLLWPLEGQPDLSPTILPVLPVLAILSVLARALNIFRLKSKFIQILAGPNFGPLNDFSNHIILNLKHLEIGERSSFLVLIDLRSVKL